jgi:hypothetical protein
MGEQERRFFHALCYAVGAEKALLQAVFRARIWRGKGFIPYPPKPRFYCVTNPKQRSYEWWLFTSSRFWFLLYFRLERIQAIAKSSSPQFKEEMR